MTQALYKAFQTDPKLEKEGIWYEPVGFGFRCRITRAGGANKRWLAALEAATKPVRRLIDQKLLSKEAEEKILMETFSRTCVLAWETSVDEQGKPDDKENYQPGIAMADGSIIPFTAENLIKFFTQDGMHDIFLDIYSQSAGNANFRVHVLEEAAKN